MEILLKIHLISHFRIRQTIAFDTTIDHRDLRTKHKKGNRREERNYKDYGSTGSKLNLHD